MYNYLGGRPGYSAAKGVTPSSIADPAGYVSRWVPLKSPLTDDASCAKTIVIFVTNPDQSGPTKDDSVNTTQLQSLGGNTQQLGLPNFSTQTVQSVTNIGQTSVCCSSQTAAASELNQAPWPTTCGNYTDGCRIGSALNNGSKVCPVGTSSFAINGVNSTVTNVPTGGETTDAKPWNSDEWARFMHDKGVPIPSSTMKSRVTFYTIDVYNALQNINHTKLMLSMAKAGGGKYFAAKSQQAILDALNQIIGEVLAVNSTFNSASLPVNATNRSQNQNQVFIRMFRPDPDAEPRWFGKLKRYQLVMGGSDVKLGDVNGSLAVNDNTGFITDCAPESKKIWIYPTMRRGGRMGYGLDVTNIDSPRLMWSVGCPNLANDSGCTPVFDGIGQTSSIPAVAFIKGYSATKPVIAMGGGYDNCEDANTGAPTCVAGKGGYVYLMDAESGSLLASFRTKRSVVSDISMIDIDYDGMVDYAYAVDLGGNVCRIDLIDGPATKASLDASNWRMYRVAYTNQATSPRKFMFGPALLYNKGFLYVTMGSGDREHPLSWQYPYESTANRFYVALDDLTIKPTTDEAGLNMDASLTNSTSPTDCNSPNVLPNGSSRGRFMELKKGEQVVTTSLIVGGGLPPSPVLASGVLVRGPSDPNNPQSTPVDRRVSVVIGSGGPRSAIQSKRVNPNISSVRKRKDTYVKGQ